MGQLSATQEEREYLAPKPISNILACGVRQKAHILQARPTLMLRMGAIEVPIRKSLGIYLAVNVTWRAIGDFYRTLIVLVYFSASIFLM